MTHADTVYDTIIKLMIDSQGLPPNVREIMQQSGIPSSSTVMDALDELERLRKIKRTRGKSRSIRVVGAQWVPPRQAEKEQVDS